MKRISSILFALALVLGLGLVATMPVVAAAIRNVPGTYSTIQAAIDAASSGDTINVAAGTYVEDLFIHPDKAGLELKGAGAAATTIKGTTVGVPGVPNINVHADGVKIHGFTIETADCAGGGWVAGLILNGVDVEIYDNHFKVVSSVATDGGAAIQTWRSENVALQNLQFGFDPARDSDVSGLKIYDNEFTGVGLGWYHPIWVNRDEGVGLAAISGNIMHGPVWCGIGTERSNTLIENNLMDTNCIYAGRFGISVHDYNDRYQEDVAVTGNTVSNFARGIDIGGGSQSVNNVSVTCNTVEDNDTGILVRSSADGVVINNNNVEDNTTWGVNNMHSAMLDATDNWWGDDSGPYHATLNPTGAGDPVSDNVGFTPWIDKSVTTATATGTASFATSDGNVVGLTAVSTPGSPPVEFPHGMFSFTICCLNPGDTVTLNVTLPAPVPVGTKWYKYNGGAWDPLPIGDDDGDNFITVTLRDDVLPDDEDTVPGQITDQGGPGEPGAVGWETYPVNKVRVFLPWIALFAAIAAGVSLLVLRHRRTTT